MAAELQRIADGESTCRLADPTGAQVSLAVLEMGPQGALLAAPKGPAFEPNAYVDCNLTLRGMAPKQFFAHVVSCDDAGLRLRWMHFDPGDEGRIRGMLDSYRTASARGGAVAGTRRVIKPSSSALPQQPAADAGAPAGSATRRVIKPSSSALPQQPAAEASPADAPAGGSATRRLIRPSSSALPKAAEVPGETSGQHQVVIAATDKFLALKDSRDEAAPPSAAGPALEKPASSPKPGTTTETAMTPFAEADAASTVPEPTPSGKTTVIKDGRMDIGASIRSRAKTVRASELAARHDKVRVLNMQTIKALIQEAVEEAAAHLTRALGEAERKRLLEEAEDNFQERLKAFQAEKLSADVRSKQLQEQLHAAQKLLEEERKRTISADQFTVSEKGLEEIDVRLRKTLERAIADGNAGPDLELKLRELISKVLDSERDRIREKELTAQNAKIALLEKKIGRLSTNLEETERQRDEARDYAASIEAAGGIVGPVVNKYKPGLKREDPNRERKLALMKELMEQNRELRRALGIALVKVEPKPPAPEPAPAEPAPPAAAEEAAAEAPEEAASADPVTPEVNPDDEPWDGAPAVPAVNPDDEPWEAPAAKAEDSAAEDERGVKKMKAFKNFEPPPLRPK